MFRAPRTRPLAAQQPGTEVEELDTSSCALKTAEEVLKNSTLVVTRDIEWGTVALGFEQASKYKVLDENGETVALLAEEETSFGFITRQLLKRRRGFNIAVLSADGSEVLFRMRRAPYLITSEVYVEDAQGNALGKVERNFSFINRSYSLFRAEAGEAGELLYNQFARIQGRPLAWDFKLETDDGRALALIDRNFQGFAKEIFTDAGKYVVHFGAPAGAAAREAERILSAAPEAQQLPDGRAVQAVDTTAPVVVSSVGEQMVLTRSLDVDERGITLAAAISADYDFFSVHSSSGGGLLPIPMFGPFFPPSADSAPPGEGGVEGPAAPSGGAPPVDDHVQDWMDQEDDDGGDDSSPGSGLGDLWGSVSEFMKDE